MAWRCTNCGRVFEGKHYPLGNNCPDGEYGKHIWIPFESALDKQNK